MKGHQWLPNNVLDLVSDYRLTKSESRILLYVCRKTDGWKRESYPIGRREFNEELRISLVYITEVTQRLQDVGILKLLNKGSSKYSYSEWKIDITDIENKLRKLDKLDGRRKEFTGKPRLTSKVGLTSKLQTTQLVNFPVAKPASLNNSLNKAIAANDKKDLTSSKDYVDRFTLLLGDSYKFENNQHYRKTLKGWDLIQHPNAYLKAVEKNNPNLKKGVIKDAKSVKNPFAVKGS